MCHQSYLSCWEYSCNPAHSNRYLLFLVILASCLAIGFEILSLDHWCFIQELYLSITPEVISTKILWNTLWSSLWLEKSFLLCIFAQYLLLLFPNRFFRFPLVEIGWMKFKHWLGVCLNERMSWVRCIFYHFL